MNDSAAEVNRDEGDARGERERRKAERRARVRERHPRIGWLLLALAGAKAYRAYEEDRFDRSGRRR